MPVNAAQSSPASAPEAASAAPALGGRKQAFLAALLLILITFAVYQHLPTFDFVDLDDGPNIFQNPSYLPPTLARLGVFWTAPYYHLYAPVTSMVWALCAAIAYVPEGILRASGGVTYLAPGVFHTTDLLLHLGNVLLVFTLLRRWFDGVLPAAAGALLFAVHPLQVEAVCWATGMNNTLAAFFGLCALLLYDTATRRGGRAATGYVVAATVIYIVALLSKPTAATVPLVALVLEVGVYRRPWRRYAPLLLLWMALSAVCAVVTQRATVGSVNGALLPLWGRPFVVGDSVTFYLGKLLLPIGLCFDYGRTPDAVLHSWWGYVTWVVPTGLFLLLWRLRCRYLLTGLAIFVGAALPTLGLVPTYFQFLSTVADRYVYLAMLGPAFALAWACTRIARWTPAGTAAAGVLAALYAGAAFVQAGTWSTSQTLFGHTVRVRPQSWFGWANEGVARYQVHDAAGAIRATERSLQLHPGQFQATLSLASLLAWQGRAAEAAPYIERARQMVPNDVEPRMLLGQLLYREGRYADAVAQFEVASKLSPYDAHVHLLLGMAEAKQGRPASAAAEYRTALGLRPGYPEAQAALALLNGQTVRPAH